MDKDKVEGLNIDLNEMQKKQELNQEIKSKTENNMVQKTRKHNSLFVTILVVLLLGIFFFGGYYMGGIHNEEINSPNYNKDVPKNDTSISAFDSGKENKKDNTSNDEKNSIKNDNKSITESSTVADDANDDDVSDPKVVKAKQILEEFGFYIKFGCKKNIYSDFYSDKFKIFIAISKVKDKAKEMSCSEFYSESDYDNNMKGYKGINGYCFNNTSAVSYNDVNVVYKKMYGTDLPKESFNSTSSDMFLFFYDYNPNKDMIISLTCGGCGGTCGSNVIINKIKSTTETENKLYIEVYYYNDIPISRDNKLILKTQKANQPIETNNYEVFKQTVKEKYLDLLPVYEVEFNKINGYYQFVRLVEKKS